MFKSRRKWSARLTSDLLEAPLLSCRLMLAIGILVGPPVVQDAQDAAPPYAIAKHATETAQLWFCAPGPRTKRICVLDDLNRPRPVGSSHLRVDEEPGEAMRFGGAHAAATRRTQSDPS